MAALYIVSVVPVLSVDIPAMVDYPNHLARMYVLSAAGTPDANPFYTVTWKPYPNLAMDLIVPWLARLAAVEQASKLFLLLSQALIVSGAVALEVAVKGRHQISGFVALLLLYSLPFAWGFLNFEFAFGIALWGLAAAEALRSRSWMIRLAVHMVFVAIIFVAHLLALGFYAVALGVAEFSRVRRGDLRRSAVNLIIIAAPVLAIWMISRSLGGSIGAGDTEWELASKLRSIFRLLNGYSAAFAAISGAVLIASLYALFRSGCLVLSRTGLWLAGGFGLLFLAMPYRLAGTAYVDVRVLVAALLVLPAYAVLTMRVRWVATAAAAVAISITLSNVVMVGIVWRTYQPEYARLKASFALISPGSRILVGRSAGGDGDLWERPMHHAPTLAVSAKALVPLLYAHPGMQPIVVDPAYRHLAIDEIIYYSPVPLAILNQRDDPRLPRFVRHWTAEYDYLFLVGPHIPNPHPDVLRELAAGERFTFYCIRPRGCPR